MMIVLLMLIFFVSLSFSYDATLLSSEKNTQNIVTSYEQQIENYVPYGTSNLISAERNTQDIVSSYEQQIENYVPYGIGRLQLCNPKLTVKVVKEEIHGIFYKRSHTKNSSIKEISITLCTPSKSINKAFFIINGSIYDTNTSLIDENPYVIFDFLKKIKIMCYLWNISVTNVSMVDKVTLCVNYTTFSINSIDFYNMFCKTISINLGIKK